jgi:hypothetical protein
MEALTPFEQAKENAHRLAENLERATAVNDLIVKLMQDESECSMTITGDDNPCRDVVVKYESVEQRDAVATLNIIATLDLVQGISA